MGRRKDAKSVLMMCGREEWVRALDRLMLATNHVSRAQLAESALQEYAQRRGFDLPVRLPGAFDRYIHADE